MTNWERRRKSMLIKFSIKSFFRKKMILSPNSNLRKNLDSTSGSQNPRLSKMKATTPKKPISSWNKETGVNAEQPSSVNNLKTPLKSRTSQKVSRFTSKSKTVQNGHGKEAAISDFSQKQVTLSCHSSSKLNFLWKEIKFLKFKLIWDLMKIKSPSPRMKFLMLT